MTDKIDWKGDPSHGYGAWVGNVMLTDTGMSVLGKLHLRIRHGVDEVEVKMNMRVEYKGTPHEGCNRNPAAATVVEALKAQEAALKPSILSVALLDQFRSANPGKDVSVSAILEWVETVVKEETSLPPADKDVEGQTHLFEDQEKEQ